MNRNIKNIWIYFDHLRLLGFQGRLLKRFASNKSHFDDPGVPRVGLSKDGKTIAMYHPRTEISYDKTTPIPRDDPRYCYENLDTLTKERLVASDLADRPVEDPTIQNMFPMHDRDVTPTVMELAGMFHTTKHQWYAGKSKKRIVTDIPPHKPNI